MNVITKAHRALARVIASRTPSLRVYLASHFVRPPPNHGFRKPQPLWRRCPSTRREEATARDPPPESAGPPEALGGTRAVLDAPGHRGRRSLARVRRPGHRTVTCPRPP